jgi:peptide deformylase
MSKQSITTLRNSDDATLLTNLSPCTTLPSSPEAGQLLAAALQNTLSENHPSPAYLAANQIGYSYNMMALYLPEDKTITIMYNPRYEAMPSGARTEGWPINTYLEPSVRFRDIYAPAIKLTYENDKGETVPLHLSGKNAKAAQMGCDYVRGVTPFDYYTKQELESFIQGIEASRTAPLIQPVMSKMILLLRHVMPISMEGEKKMWQVSNHNLTERIQSFLQPLTWQVLSVF